VSTGRLIAGRFLIERHAGSGGMGTVYRGTDITDNTSVAIKMLSGGDATHLRWLHREAAVLSSFSHPNIVRYIAHGVDEGEAFLAMEWLEGEDLSMFIARRPLTPQETITLGTRICEALAAAHRKGVVHRDIKPANVFLVDGSLVKVKLVDFGIARKEVITNVNASSAGMVVGSPGFMAPEQARADPDIDARADVYSLGCVLYACLTNTPPFTGDHLMAILAKILLHDAPRVRDRRPDVPEAFEALLLRMLAKERDARPADAYAVAEELSRVAAAALATPAAGAPPAPAVITTGEQSYLSIVLAGRSVRDDTTLASTEILERVQAVRALSERFGARIERLADGTIVGVFQDLGYATDQAAMAARAALALRQVTAGGPIVIATGRGMVSGSLPVGEVIDRAVALLRRAGHAGIHLDEVTVSLLDGRFQLQKGAQTMTLVGEVQEGGPRRLLGKATAFVGRDRELAFLEGLYDASVEEPGARAALVIGPPGVGKSRLRAEVVGKLQRRDEPPEIWIGRADPVRAGSPFSLLADALRASLGLRGGEAKEAQLAAIQARVSERLPDEGRHVGEALAQIVGVHAVAGDMSGAARDAMVAHDRMRRAFEAWLTATLDVRPLVIVLEDLHWGDWPTVRFLDSALRNLGGRPLMIVAFARPDVKELFPSLWAERTVDELLLRELPRRACERLVRQVLGELDAGRVAALVDQAQGNPFFLEEMIRAVGEGGDNLPTSVLAMVNSRLARLSPEARHVLRAGSVFGQAFWQDGVAALVGATDPARVEAGLRELVEREWIARQPTSRLAGQRELVIGHALVRDVAYTTLPDEDRILGHSLAATWLESAGEQDALVLAEHFERGGEQLRAVGWFRRAAQQALEANDLPAAIARAERGVACGAVGGLLGVLRLVQAEAHNWRAGYAEAERCALEALETLPRESTAWANAAHQLSWSALRQGKDDVVSRIADDLFQLGEERPTTQLVLALAAIATHLVQGGRQEQALVAVGLADRRAAGLPADANVSAWREFAHALVIVAGTPDRIIGHFRTAAARWEEVGDHRNACLARINAGYASIELGLHEDAEHELRRAVAMATRLGAEPAVAAAEQNLGLALWRRGALGEARDVLRSAIAKYHADQRNEAVCRLYLALVHLDAGALDEAERELSLAGDGLASLPAYRAYILAVRARVARSCGQLVAGLAHAVEAMAILDSLGTLEEGEAYLRLVHAELLHALGDPAAAQAVGSAREKLYERAYKIEDRALRESFLTRVPEHAATLALAIQLQGATQR
jgi:eukaryotic-like serine/threonine-protein kinase